jgi:peptide/nickel transport system substrate-binding protein
VQRGLTNYPDLYGALGLVGPRTCTGRATCDVSRGVAVRGDTITFRLSQPNAHFLLQLAAVPPIPPGTPLKVDPKKPPPGTGPYTVETIAPRREVTLVRNRRFRVWAAAARPDGYPDEIVWRVVRAAKAVDMVAAGRADVVGAPADRVSELKARYGAQLHIVAENATTFLFLNTRQRPFDDERVRRAVNFAIDRAEVVKLHGGPDVAQPTCQTVPPSLPGYVRYCPYTVDADSSGVWKAPDLETAKRLIAASGTAGAKVEVWTFDFFAPEARYTVKLLRQLGYRAGLHEIPRIDTYFATIASKHPQAGFAGWFGLQLPKDIFDTLSCDYSSNYADFCDRAIDRDVQRLGRLEGEDPPAAATLAAHIDRTIVDRAPWVPLFTPRLADFVSKRVGNYQYNVYDNGFLPDQVWVR